MTQPPGPEARRTVSNSRGPRCTPMSSKENLFALVTACYCRSGGCAATEESLRAVSEARRLHTTPESQILCLAHFRYSDLNGAARVCGGRGQTMGFERVSFAKTLADFAI